MPTTFGALFVESPPPLLQLCDCLKLVNSPHPSAPQHLPRANRIKLGRLVECVPLSSFL